MRKLDELGMDFANPESRRELMRNYGDSAQLFVGTNEDGEEVHMSVSKKSIVVKTYQNNGWCRVNCYDENGFCSAESFEGKWR